jgi:hypothetical protein
MVFDEVVEILLVDQKPSPEPNCWQISAVDKRPNRPIADPQIGTRILEAH